MSKWKTYRLNEVFTFASGLSKAREYFGTGYDFVSFKDVFNNIFLPESLNALVQTSENERKSCSVLRGDVFLTRTSETYDELGISSVALNDYPNATFNGFTKRLRPVGNVTIVPEYAGYYFRSPKFRSLVTQYSSITTRASLNNEILSNLTIDVPSEDLQIEIGKILKSLDDKIELNLQMNQTLESMAQAIFKEWFVLSTSSGQRTFNFPGFDGELVDGLPKGWRMRKLGEVISFVKGKKPGDVSIEQEEGYLPQILIDTFNTGNSVFANPNRMVIASPEEMLMVMDGASSGRIEIGYAGIVGSTIAKIVLKNQFAFPLYIYFFLKTKEKDIMGNTTGSSIPHADKNKILDYDLVIPNKDTFQLFEETASSLLNKIKLNKTETRTLIQVRDGLLPKLMTGKIEIQA